MKILVVGCGNKPKLGAVNLDKFPLPGVDVVFDLDWCGPTRMVGAWEENIKNVRFGLPKYFKEVNGLLLPFDSNQFDRIECEDVLEHVEYFVDVVQELLRVLKVGGTLWVRGPDCNFPEQCWADPTHRRLFAPRTFDNFDPESWDGNQYGHYFGERKVRVMKVESVNRGYEYTMVKR